MARLIADASKMTDIQKKLGITVDESSMSFDNIVNAIEVMQANLGIAGATAAEASETISGSFGAMKSAWENLIVGIATGDADLNGMIENLVTSATTFAGNIMPVVETALVGIGSLVAGLGPIIAEQVPAMIATALPALVQSGASLLGAVSSGILTQLPALLKVALEIITTLAGDISTSLPEMIPTIISIVTEIVATLTDSGTLGSLIDAALAIIVALANGVIASLPELIGRVPEIVTNVVSTLIENAPKLLDAAIEIIASLASSLIQSIPDLVAAVPDLVSALVGEFKSMVADFISIGSNIVDGIKQGISDAWNALTGWVGEKFNGLITGVKTRLQIASPSKVFAEIGGYMAEGLAVGWNNEFGAVKDQIEGSMEFETATVGVSIGDRQVQALNGLTNVLLSSNNNVGGVPAVINLMTPEGDTFATWQLPSLIRVADAAGTPILSRQ